MIITIIIITIIIIIIDIFSNNNNNNPNPDNNICFISLVFTVMPYDVKLVLIS